ncbi:MAG: hypothetical protein ABJB97_09920 [Acidobacteriota bacterium]
MDCVPRTIAQRANETWPKLEKKRPNILGEAVFQVLLRYNALNGGMPPVEVEERSQCGNIMFVAEHLGAEASPTSLSVVAPIKGLHVATDAHPSASRTVRAATLYGLA